MVVSNDLATSPRPPNNSSSVLELVINLFGGDGGEGRFIKLIIFHVPQILNTGHEGYMVTADVIYHQHTCG